MSHRQCPSKSLRQAAPRSTGTGGGSLLSFSFSVPSIFFWWQWGKWNIAAIAHDYIYEHGYINGVNPDKSETLKLECTRSKADQLFFANCLALGVNPITAFLMFLACRLFGWIWWKHD